MAELTHLLAFNNLSFFNQFLADNPCRHWYFLKTDTHILINTEVDTDMFLANTDMIEIDTDISVSTKNICQLIYRSISIFYHWFIDLSSFLVSPIFEL